MKFVYGLFWFLMFKSLNLLLKAINRLSLKKKIETWWWWRRRETKRKLM